MKQRDQKKRREIQPFKRKLHFSDGETWSYRVGQNYVVMRSPEGKTHEAILPDVTGESWNDIERAQWKHYWDGVRPQAIKNYIGYHLRPPPEFHPVTHAYMHPYFFGHWHMFWDCHVLPHEKNGQAFDPAVVDYEDLEGHLGAKATRLNFCPVCMHKYAAQFRCMDCHEPDPEYYMVWDQLWEKAVPDGSGKLCFSCLGKRLGRPLRQNDFPKHVPLNQMGDLPERIAKLAP